MLSNVQMSFKVRVGVITLVRACPKCTIMFQRSRVRQMWGCRWTWAPHPHLISTVSVAGGTKRVTVYRRPPLTRPRTPIIHIFLSEIRRTVLEWEEQSNITMIITMTHMFIMELSLIDCHMLVLQGDRLRMH